GIDERIAVLGPHHGHAVEAVGLEHCHHSLPPVAAAPRRRQHGCDLVRQVRAAVGDHALTGLHLHNTRGLGLANVLAGLEVGITTFDSSLGGLGGCPFAPGASGNIVTEDLVFMLEAMGITTGIDLGKLLNAREVLASALPHEPLYGFVHAAGLPLGFDAAS
ncbi:MAG: hypothetical protein EBR51_12750, partial [Gammaproteobacteria bacterium]|nr:hypothetical protein [Gammaproteobacteria bacterium]